MHIDDGKTQIVKLTDQVRQVFLAKQDNSNAFSP